jgi:hypothetical protein
MTAPERSCGADCMSASCGQIQAGRTERGSYRSSGPLIPSTAEARLSSYSVSVGLIGLSAGVPPGTASAEEKFRRVSSSRRRGRG